MPVTLDAQTQGTRDAAVDEAAAALRRGALVAVPTETTYGVAAAATQPEAVARLRAACGLSEDAAVALNLPSAGDAVAMLAGHDALTRRAAVRLLPHAVTLRVALDARQRDGVLRRLGLTDAASAGAVTDGRTIGLRVPATAATTVLLHVAGGPVVVAGARDASGRPAVSASGAAEGVPDAAVVLDGGRCAHAWPSTLVDVGAGRLSVARVGVLDERYLRKLMRRTILLVCTGNTCRSPMAEGVARWLVAESLGVATDELDAAGVRVVSAGVFAGPGSPASPEAVAVMAERGIDLSSHGSRPLSAELVNEAEVIYTMTEGHRQAVTAAAPSVADRTHRLDPDGDIADPIGGPTEAYVAAADQITSALRARIKELEL